MFWDSNQIQSGRLLAQETAPDTVMPLFCKTSLGGSDGLVSVYSVTLNVNNLKGELKYRLIRYIAKHDLSICCL